MTTNFSYGNRTLRAVHHDDRFWFLLEDISALAGVDYKGRSLRSAGLRPGIDFVKVNVSELPDDVSNSHLRSNAPRILVSDGGFFELVFRGQSEYSTGFRSWVKDEMWPALINEGYYAVRDDSLVKQLLDEVVLLRAEVTVLHAERSLYGDATLADLIGTAEPRYNDFFEEGDA